MTARVTPRHLAAIRENGGGPLAERIAWQREHIRRLVNDLAMAERRISDMSRENDRLRREIAALKSAPIERTRA